MPHRCDAGGMSDDLRYPDDFRQPVSIAFPIGEPHLSVHIPAPMDLRKYLKTRGRTIEQALDRYLPKATAKPPTIHRAMRYSLFAGGKRLRPILCLAAAEACGGRPEDALPVASAI